jgi:hypothetical protein
MSDYYRGDVPATAKQLATLREILPPHEHGQLYGLTRQGAHEMLKARIEEWRKLPATPNQEAVLRRNMLFRPGMTRGQASDSIANLYGPRRPPGAWGGLGGGGTKCEPD